MRIVIVGADAAGMSAASQLRRLAPAVEVVVLEKTHDVSYGACGLPYKLRPDDDVESLVVVSAAQFRAERGIDLRVGHTVTGIDRGARTVSGDGPDGRFEVGYDKLILATGAAAIVPPIEGLRELGLEGVCFLKTLQDGRDLRAALATEPRRVVIIGGGYIGLEAADNLRELGLEVTVVEALPELLPFLPEGGRARVIEELAAHGVELRVGTRATRVSRDDGAGGRLRVDTRPGTPLHADLVIVAVGVRANSDLAAAAGLPLGVGGSIAVDAASVTEDPDVLAVGDCAEALHALTGAATWVPLALRANRAGKLAAFTALGRRREAPPILGTAVFKLFDLAVARTGLTVAEARDAGLEPVAVEVTTGATAHYYRAHTKLQVGLVADRGSGRLVGATLVGPVGSAHRIDTVAAVLHLGATPAQLYDMDLAYAPPFGPAWSPWLTAASVLGKKLRRG